MNTNHNALIHPTKTFFGALNIDQTTFYNDWNGVGESTLEDLMPEMLKTERPHRIEELHGSFDQHRGAIERASHLGAKIYAELNTDEGWVIACRTTADKGFSGAKQPGPPDVVVADSDMVETAYWKVKGGPLPELKDLKDRLDEHFDGDPYFGGINPKMRLPGFEYHDGATDSNDHKPRIVSTPSTAAQPRTAAEIAKCYKSVPRRKAMDRQRAIEDVLKFEVPLSHTCSTEKEVAETCFKIKEAGIAKGYSLSDMLYFCLAWNHKQKQRFSKATCIEAFYRDERMKSREEGLPDSRGVKPLFSMRSARIDYFIDEPPPITAWVLENTLPKGKVAMLAARGGTGKSQFALQLAASVATGEICMGQWSTETPIKVIYFGAEDEDCELHRRVHNIANAMAAMSKDQATFYELLRKNLHVKSMLGSDNRMTSNDYGKEVTETDFSGRLLQTLAGSGPFGLIIVDPASRFRGGNENAAEDTTRFVEALERLSAATGATVLVIHHVNKWSGRDGEQLQEAARGSSAFTDGVRWQMNLAGMTVAEAKEFSVPEEERGFFLTATITKNNYAPPQPKVFLKRCDGGVLSAATLVSGKKKQAEDLTTRVLDLVRNEAHRGALYSKSSFEASFGGLGSMLKIGKVALRKLLDDLIGTGKLVPHRGKLALPGSLVPHTKLPGV